MDFIHFICWEDELKRLGKVPRLVRVRFRVRAGAKARSNVSVGAGPKMMGYSKLRPVRGASCPKRSLI